uniref:Flp pilus assembly protein CpaB n=1 Tax=Saccharopolyspora galaxeae TaxID=2781241 RepID=UPI001F1FC175|nr:SAF domain-containing protein [Saccharopolyspora sp. HNM0986]
MSGRGSGASGNPDPGGKAGPSGKAGSGGNRRRGMRRRRRKELSLEPTWRDRVSARLPWLHGVRVLFARRAAAGMLIVLALLLAVRPESAPPDDRVRVVVAAHDLAPGHVLTDSDLAQRALPADAVPRGAVREVAAARGRTLGGASRGGEPLTDVRFTGPELTRITTGREDHVAVPIRLADPAVADLLRSGTRVDIVTIPTRSDTGSVLAERVPVLAVRPAGSGPDQGRLVVVGLPEQRAPAVAGASLTRSVTVTLR